MKVTTSCSGRFWVFDQARELYRIGVLDKLINDYPRFKTREWGIPDDKVISLLGSGIRMRAVNRMAPVVNKSWRDRLSSSAHRAFTRKVADKIPDQSDVFIGLSSFALEALYQAKEKGQLTVVDHGSSHQRYERQLQREEDELWGFRGFTQEPPQWVIDREQEEFEVADRIMVLSSYARRTMVENGIDEKKIFVNRCGVNLDQFEPGEKKDDTFRVIQCGGLRPGKGVHYLIKAFRELGIRDSELWLIGGGYQDSPLKTFFEENRSENIQFKGTYPQNRLKYLYQQGSVFVLNSLSDGFGMVVTQAMACALPVIVTENVGAADLVEDGKNGFVIPIRDVEALKERLTYLYENQDERRRMGQNAYQTILSGNTWQEYGERLADYLQEEIAKN